MSKVGGGSSEQQQKTDPWDGLKPYLIGLDGKTGIMPEAERLFKEAAPEYFKGDTYAGLNDVQNGAISKLLDYYKSPASMSGANAANNLGNSLLGKTELSTATAIPANLMVSRNSAHCRNWIRKT